MTSGVYLLTFKSGKRYIGKSNNIERRWEEHQEKMHSGTAAKLVQQEYYDFGLPKCTLLTECHPNHIGLLESCYIRALNPELNCAKTDPITTAEFELLQSSSNELKLSTCALIKQYKEYEVFKNNNHAMEVIKGLQYENKLLREKYLEASKSWWTRIFG